MQCVETANVCHCGDAAIYNGGRRPEQICFFNVSAVLGVNRGGIPLKSAIALVFDLRANGKNSIHRGTEFLVTRGPVLSVENQRLVGTGQNVVRRLFMIGDRLDLIQDFPFQLRQRRILVVSKNLVQRVAERAP